MKKASLFLSLICLLIIPLLLPSCAVNPTCPGNLMPIVEIQINNTASNHDDYGTAGGYTICQARVTNYQGYNKKNFPGGVAVELRNPAGGLVNLLFSGSASLGSASMFVTLPDDGSWLPFYVRGTVTNPVDKTAIVEIATAGATCAETVVARKAMMIPPGAPPIPATPVRPRVEIEVGSVATLDDYIAWSPLSCRIRWASGSAGSTLPVTLRNMAGTDRLRFAANGLGGGATATSQTLPLILNGDGSWVSFYLAGNWTDPLQGPVGSVSDKDAVMEVIDSISSLLSRDAVMVRIRKNGNTLSPAERDRYLRALNRVDVTTSSVSGVQTDYIDLVKTHSRDNTGAGGSQVSHRQAHGGSAFLPWHRAFVLHLERLLQAADPSVALPYWKFDAPAPNIFSADFMGSNSSVNMATLAPGTNPIFNWTLLGEGTPTGIQRRTPYDGNTGNPTVLGEGATLALGGPGFDYAGFKSMEGSAHNPAHSTSGSGISWIAGSPAIATRDPLFFSLHCNVDRLWAKWQWVHGRYSITQVSVYDLQGSHASPGAGVALPSVFPNRTLGQYADDTMWPWDNVIGGAAGTTAERPNIAILTPFPITVGALFPGAQPRVKDLIDYLMITNPAPAPGLAFGYDDFFPY